VVSRVNKRVSVGGDEVFYSGSLPGQVTIRRGIEKRPLAARFDLHKHVSMRFTAGTGFAWGAPADAGSSQLSLALLADALGDDARALQLHQRFNRRVVTILPDRWTITRSRIVAHAEVIEQRTAAGLDEI
jgi:hypothetical protein